jgi:hypothetical protein
MAKKQDAAPKAVEEQTEPPEGLRMPPVVDAKCVEQLRAFLADWREDPPAEAARGSYGTTVNDRWAKQAFDDVPDGMVMVDGWCFGFAGGRFTGAVEIGRLPPFFIEQGQSVPITAKL